jgi:hypothetical protein
LTANYIDLVFLRRIIYGTTKYPTEIKNFFVYGKLRPLQSVSRPDDSPFYPEIAPYVIGTTLAWVKGALLYDHGAYPYVCPSAGTVTASHY